MLGACDCVMVSREFTLPFAFLCVCLHVCAYMCSLMKENKENDETRM